MRKTERSLVRKTEGEEACLSPFLICQRSVPTTTSGSPLPFISKVLERDQFGPWSSTGEPDMSNGNGISFVHDLVAMATAADKVPQLEEQISELRKALDAQTASNWELEAKIIDHTNAHSETKARLHNAEVARDDAERLFLEADDAKLAAVRAMRVVIGEAEAFVKAMTPVEAKPSYEGKWLWDVQGWSGISLNQWLENGGSTARFIAVKLDESQRATDPTQAAMETNVVAAPVGIASGSGLIQLGTESEVGPTANILGLDHGLSPSVPSGLASREESVSTITVEGECAPNPTVETLTGS